MSLIDLFIHRPIYLCIIRRLDKRSRESLLYIHSSLTAILLRRGYSDDEVRRGGPFWVIDAACWRRHAIVRVLLEDDRIGPNVDYESLLIHGYPKGAVREEILRHWRRQSKRVKRE